MTGKSLSLQPADIRVLRIEVGQVTTDDVEDKTTFDVSGRVFNDASGAVMGHLFRVNPEAFGQALVLVGFDPVPGQDPVTADAVSEWVEHGGLGFLYSYGVRALGGIASSMALPIDMPPEPPEASLSPEDVVTESSDADPGIPE